MRRMIVFALVFNVFVLVFVLRAQQAPSAYLAPETLAFAIRQDSSTWEGIYRVNGVNPNGGIYSGALQIARSSESALLYELTWMLDAIPDQIAMTGIGYEHDGFLIVAGTSTPLLASYDKDGQGFWTAPHLSGPTHENLTRTPYETLTEALRPMILDPKPVGEQI